MSGGGLGEAQLEAIEKRLDPESIPSLVATLRQQQRELDNLRMSLEVARRDREELRIALIRAQEELKKASG